MISIDRVTTYAKSQCFRPMLKDGTLTITDRKGNVSTLLEGYEGGGVPRELLDLIAAETQP